MDAYPRGREFRTWCGSWKPTTPGTQSLTAVGPSLLANAWCMMEVNPCQRRDSASWRGVSFERLATPPPQQQSVPEGDKNNMSVGRYSRDSLSQPENYCNGPPGSACRSQGMVAFWKFWKFYNHLLKPNL